MDDIQRKLSLIDAQLAEGRNFHSQIIATCPLLFAAAGLIAGIALQDVIAITPWIWLTLLVILTLSAVCLFAMRKATPATYIAGYIALACFACLGAVRLTAFNQTADNDIRNFIGDQRTLATVRGIIVTEPQTNSRQWQFARFKYTDPGCSFYLRMCEVESTAGWTKAVGAVRVQVDEPLLDLKAGDHIQAYCWLERFKEPQNPGQFNVAEYLARKNVYISASIKSREAIEVIESSPASLFARVQRKLTTVATHALIGDLAPQERNRSLLHALLLGYRANIDSRTYEAFRKTGLLHFISLSGMHLGILMGLIWWLCKTAGFMKRGCATICIIAIAIFLVIVPPRAPTLRAAIICWLFCLSFYFRRYSSPLNTLSLGAIILLLIRPTQLFEAGWQLSFTSVLGIILFTERIHFFVYEKMANVPWCRQTLKAKPAAGTLKLFSVGLAAWLASAGILLFHFYTINPLTSLWTVLVFPLVALILIIGYLQIVISFFLPTAAALLGVIANGSAGLLIWLVEQIADLGVSQILIGHVSAAPIVLYYCFVIFAGFPLVRRPLIKKAVCTISVLAIVVFLGAVKWQRTHRDNLILTCLDVGHGQAILAQLPGNQNILFDAGSLHRSDIGRRIIAPFLDYQGISRIDAIVISHNDADHINAIPEVIDHCRVQAVYANHAFFDAVDSWGTAKFLNQCLTERALEAKKIQPLLTTDDTVRITSLWPSERLYPPGQLSENDTSLVSLIEFAGAEILLCSDIEQFAQGQLLRTASELNPDIVIVPHHGSANTLNADFLVNLDADIAISSCSRSQYDRHKLTGRMNKENIFFTARDGAITVRIDSKGAVRTHTSAAQQ